MAAPASIAAQLPQALGLQLQTDQKQHQDHAEFGEMEDVLHVGDQAQSPGADADAGGQVADDGAEAEFFGQWYGNDGGREVDKTVDKPGRCGFHAVTIAEKSA